MTKYGGRLIFSGMIFVFGSSIAHAQTDHMQLAGLTSQPIGHYNYCKSYRADCEIRTSRFKPVKLTSKRWAEMVEVNNISNTSIAPVTDLEGFGVEEFWTYPTSYGDCEDYVLMKRQMLIARGFPPSSLLITVVLQANGDGHAVLTVRTDRADYILDNLTNKILQWDKTEYTFLKRQSERDSGKWIKIVDDRNEKTISKTVSIIKQ